MPSIEHETVVSLLQSHPEWLDPLLAATGHAIVARTLSAIDATVRFVEPAEVRPDLLFGVAGQADWVAVEIQMNVDASKQRRWLLATSLLLNERGTMGDLVVITAQRHVAEWASDVAQASGPLGSRLGLGPVVVLLSGDRVEQLLDPDHPELAFFAAWAMHERHGSTARRVVREALDLASALPSELRAAQIRAIFNVLSEPMLAHLRETTMNPQSVPESPGVRAWREELEARGEARGKAVGGAMSLLAILEAREIAVDSATRATVLATVDAAVLERWIRRAATATSLEEVFA